MLRREVPHAQAKQAGGQKAAALAQAGKATLVTSDEDFERVRTALKILWV